MSQYIQISNHVHLKLTCSMSIIGPLKQRMKWDTLSEMLTQNLRKIIMVMTFKIVKIKQRIIIPPIKDTCWDLLKD